jgi:hypothetical protein
MRNMKRIIVIAVATIMTTTSAVAQANITTPWGSLTVPMVPRTRIGLEPEPKLWVCVRIAGSISSAGAETTK